MTLKQLIDKTFSLNEEEELDAIMLSKRISTAIETVNKTISVLDEKMNDANASKELVPSFKESLTTLCGDSWELKEIASRLLKKDTTNQAAINALNTWKLVRSKINRLKAKILEWNRKHPKNQLPNVEEICNIPIRENSL